MTHSTNLKINRLAELFLHHFIWYSHSSWFYPKLDVVTQGCRSMENAESREWWKRRRGWIPGLDCSRLRALPLMCHTASSFTIPSSVDNPSC
jgi:hypothetical protein